MAYQTGTATNINDLLEKVAAFAVSLDWVIDKTASGSLFLHNDKGFWSFYYNTSTKMLEIFANTGFTNNAGAAGQPGSSSASGHKAATTGLTGGNYTAYYFFGSAQYIHVVVEIAPNRFRHFGIGTLNKEGDYVGGEYAFGTYLYPNYEYTQNYSRAFGFGGSSSNSQAVVRADGIAGNSRSPWYFFPYEFSGLYKNISANNKGKYLLALGNATLSQSQYNKHPDSYLLWFGKSNFGNAVIPCPHSLIAPTIQNTFIRLGTVPDRYECRMEGVIPKQIFEINGDKWMLIPAAQLDERNINTIESGKDNSGVQGVAYRIVE